jgi:hypothetical protein
MKGIGVTTKGKVKEGSLEQKAMFIMVIGNKAKQTAWVLSHIKMEAHTLENGQMINKMD